MGLEGGIEQSYLKNENIVKLVCLHFLFLSVEMLRKCAGKKRK